MPYTLLISLLLPALGFPFVYLAGRKSAKAAALAIALITIANLALILTTVPAVLNNSNNRYEESYTWIPVFNSQFSLFVDGISLSMVILTLTIVLAAVIFSINYMQGRKNLATYYALISLLSVGLVGVFIASNLLLFYFFWELMIVPAYFILGNWGYKDSYKAAFKFFVYTHAGAVFIVLGIGGIFMLTNTLDMSQAAQLLMNANPEYVKYILLAVTAGFAVKMAIVPLHSWLPDAYSEASRANVSSFKRSNNQCRSIRSHTHLPANSAASTPNQQRHLRNRFSVRLKHFWSHLSFFGSFLALRETDIKKVMAYSSIAHMGYILFGFSLFPIQIAMTGTVLQIITHGVSKGLFFLTAGAIMTQLSTRNIREMGGLAGKMPTTSTTSIIAALSPAGTPPFACFISEVLIFMGAFQAIQAGASFFIIPTALMLIATVLSLGYSLRFISNVFLWATKNRAKNY